MAIDPDLCIEVPADFDDSGSESQVHPIARKMFSGRTNAEVFRKAQVWADGLNVHLLDVAWDKAELGGGAIDEISGEELPYTLTVYFSFEFEDED
ncbi:hypothetical protein [Streptomonospora salina]|uniref:Uncharacterized protein n=1 Tax=Streptomonospora salina TaxID=104205 RepID=A0A841EBB0_9ACTN|nr:hypothetical protein [Streptomonospora salina]MBB5998353.1 hypothetical protein [Streptomonospora salina]